MFDTNEDEQNDDSDTEDTDLEDENSEDGEDEDESDSEDEDDDDSDEEDDSDEDDDKPVTRKDLKAFRKSIANKDNAKRRIASKKGDITKPPKPNERLDRIEQAQKQSALLERKRMFGYENNLSPDEVDIVFKLGKRPTKKFLDLPYVKGALEGHRADKNVRNNTPSSNGRAFQANGKEWKDMKADEKQANFKDRRQAILDAKRNK